MSKQFICGREHGDKYTDYSMHNMIRALEDDFQDMSRLCIPTGIALLIYNTTNTLLIKIVPVRKGEDYLASGVAACSFLNIRTCRTRPRSPAVVDPQTDIQEKAL